MPQVNLSTLSGPELRRLLDATRERGEAALSYQILQEMAARRETGGRRGLSAVRRPAEPRMITVDLGDPMEPRDEPGDLPEPEAALEPAPRRSRPWRRKTPTASPVSLAAAVEGVDVELPPPPSREPKPRSVWDADPEPPRDSATSDDGGLRLRPPAMESFRAPRLPRRGPVAGFAVGIAVGIGLGWWVGGVTREAPPPSVASAPVPIRTAALSPPPAPAPAPVVAPAAEPEPAAEPAEAPPEPSAAPPQPDLPEGPVASPDAMDVAQAAPAEPMETPQAPPAPRATPAGARGCATQPTPADQAICGDPDLRRLQRELRQAYAEALEAHEDRALLRQRQLAWREARNTVSEPERLARLYEQRIRKLNAATAEALHQR